MEANATGPVKMQWSFGAARCWLRGMFVGWLHPHFWKRPIRWHRQLDPHRLHRQEDEWQQSPGRWSQFPPRRMHARLKT